MCIIKSDRRDKASGDERGRLLMRAIQRLLDVPDMSMKAVHEMYRRHGIGLDTIRKAAKAAGVESRRHY